MSILLLTAEGVSLIKLGQILILLPHPISVWSCLICEGQGQLDTKLLPPQIPAITSAGEVIPSLEYVREYKSHSAFLPNRICQYILIECFN